MSSPLRPLTPQEQQAKLVRDCRLRLDPAKFLPETFPEEAPGGPRRRQRRASHVTKDQVVARSGYGHTWYYKLEAGQDEGFTDHYLSVIATILEMTPEETTMLFSLATRSRPPRGAPEEELRDSRIIQWVLEELSCPAYIIDSAWYIISSNTAMKKALPWVTESSPNFMLWALTSDDARSVLYNRDTEWVPSLWAEMQYALARQQRNAKLSALIGEVLELSPVARQVSKLPLVYVNPDGARRRIRLPGREGKIHAIEQVSFIPQRAPASRVMMIIELDDTQH